jgi:hypothetical protein
MAGFVKFLAILAGVAAIARIAQSPKVCVCAGPFCACGYRR